jgi:hypothetical protein
MIDSPAVIAPSADQKGTDLRLLTKAVFGRPLSMSSLVELVEGIEVDGDVPTGTETDEVWVASIGYEGHRDVDVFAMTLATAGVERLLDVRELPISRKKGFAKTALSEALERAGIEYRHLKPLGNPKAFRDLYKSGDVAGGRTRYQRFLLSERPEALADLEALLHEKRSALMCVETDQAICHRDVIFNALQAQMGLNLNVAELA